MKEYIVLLDNIRSALNVGSILRTSDGAGFKKVILTGFTPKVEHPKVKKTALGAESSIVVTYEADALEAIKKLKTEGYTVIAIEEISEKQVKHELNNSEDKNIDKDVVENTDLFAYNFKDDRIVLVFGNEVLGVNPEILKIADEILKLPMAGIKNSLNVAVTVSAVLYLIKYKEYESRK